MDIRLETTCPLSPEHQALVDTLNRFLAWLPEDKDPDAARRLALEMLEAADIAPQAVLAQAVGFSQSRSVRVYRQRLREERLAGLFDHPISGRPAVTTQTAVEKAVIQVILEAVIAERTLLLHKFIRRPATLYLVETELHVVFDPCRDSCSMR